MTDIILIRHAEPSIETGAASDTWVLTDAGRQAAAALAPKLLGFDISEITTSPEPKALQTAEIVAQLIGAGIFTDARLREHGRKTVGFLNRSTFEAGISSIFGKPDEIAFGDESENTVHARFCSSINDAISRSSGVVAAVTHGTAMTIYASRLTGIAPMPFWNQLTMPAAILIKDGVVEKIA